MKLLKGTDRYEVLQGGSLTVGGVLKSISEYPLREGFIPLYSGGRIGIVPSVHGEKITWIKPKSMNLYVADRCLLVGINRQNLASAGLMDTTNIVTIDEEKYIFRLIKAGDSRDGAPNEWDDFLDAIGTEDNELLHWKGVCFWGKETVQGACDKYVLRGGQLPRFTAQAGPDYKDVHAGFRPVLVRLNGTTEAYEQRNQSEYTDKPIETGEGCRYCMDQPAWAFRCDVRIDTTDYMPKDIPVPVRYCPNCGRKIR